MLYDFFNSIYFFSLICGGIATVVLIISKIIMYHYSTYTSNIIENTCIKLKIISSILFTIFVIGFLCVSYIKIFHIDFSFLFYFGLFITLFVLFSAASIINSCTENDNLFIKNCYYICIFMLFTIVFYNVTPRDLKAKKTITSDFIIINSNTQQICRQNNELIKIENSIEDYITDTTNNDNINETENNEKMNINYYYIGEDNSLKLSSIPANQTSIKLEDSNNCYIETLTYGKLWKEVKGKKESNTNLGYAYTKYIIHIPKNTIKN